MNALKQKIEETKAQIAALNQQVEAQNKQLFSELASELFKTHPQLLSINFQAYTIYFNDGNECTYSAHTDYAEIDTEEGADKEAIQTDVDSFLNSFSDSFWENLVGDHVDVTITKDGLTTAKYTDHD